MRRVLALTVPALGFAACGSADRAPARAAPPPPALESELGKIVAAGSPGVIASVDDGHGLALKAAGVADVTSHRPLRPTDRFRAGSNTKTMVAAVALQLVAESQLSLSDTVERRLPGVLPYGEQVSLRQLLNMTSGVPDYVPGLMIERATHDSLGAQLARPIFEPLGMRDTSLPGATSAIAGAHTHGYGDVGGKLRDLTDFNASAGWAGGGAVTTATDMARFWRGLLSGRLLAPKQLEAMKTTVRIAPGYPGRYGLGIFRWTQYATSCGTVWGDGGDLPGFGSEFLNSEDGSRHSGVIVNVNPIPKAVSGEPLGSAKRAALADAVGRDHC